jgi:hypothetical protein
LERLTQACEPASFSVNEKVLDETYHWHKAGKMDMERFASALRLDLAQTDLIKIISHYLLEGIE